MRTSADTHLADVLHERGQRVTPQRLAIHRALRKLDRHASAEEVRDTVDEWLPGVSTPTVYATLELLDELGLARRVGPVGGRVLFDPRVDGHAHLVCVTCGEVSDLETGVDTRAALREAQRSGYSGARAGVVVTGVCRSCAR